MRNLKSIALALVALVAFSATAQKKKSMYLKAQLTGQVKSNR